MIRRIGDAMARLSARRTPIGSRPPATIGVLMQWGIGDAVLTTPLLDGLRAEWPEARIDAIGKPWLADLFAGDHRVDRCIPLVPPWTRLKGKYCIWGREWRIFAHEMAAARRTPYDLLVSIRWDIRELIVSRLLRAAAVAGFAAVGGRSWVTTDLALDASGHAALHRSVVAAHAAHVLTGCSVPAAPSLSIMADERRHVVERIRGAGYAGGPVVAVHAGAGSIIRRWPIERFNAVLRSLGNRAGCLVLIDDQAAAPLTPPADVPYLRWSGTLSCLKAMLSACDILLCNDAGPMHVAAAVGCQTVAIFGPGMDSWFRPTGPGHRIVIEEPMPCRPCFDRCIYPSAICLERIGVDRVGATLHDVLGELPVSSPASVAGDLAR